jgi:hypothetical protein
MPRVVVCGALANKVGNGGATWTRLSWLFGFRQLGCEVYFIEQLADGSGIDRPAAVAYFHRTIERFGLGGAAALIDANGTWSEGANFNELLSVAQNADLLVNITGHLTYARLFERFRRKVYVDLDPGFTQIWYADGTSAMHLDGHDAFFTVGENIGTPECSIPTGGIPWRPIRQPIVLDQWPMAPVEAPDRFTTIASWRGPYAPIQFQGQQLGLKVHEFRKFISVPELAPASFELALDIHPSEVADLSLLEQHGWQVVDPRSAAGDTHLFRCYVQRSGAEFSAAQGVYVHTRSGWFSDRTVRYLASGKPAVVQDTGLTKNYPTGCGLLAFSSIDEAVRGVENVMRDYATHSRAARSLAEEYFAADKVLGRMLSELGIES